MICHSMILSQARSHQPLPAIKSLPLPGGTVGLLHNPERQEAAKRDTALDTKPLLVKLDHLSDVTLTEDVLCVCFFWKNPRSFWELKTDPGFLRLKHLEFGELEKKQRFLRLMIEWCFFGFCDCLDVLLDNCLFLMCLIGVELSKRLRFLSHRCTPPVIIHL